MTILVREQNPEVIHLDGFCYDLSYGERQSNDETPIDCFCDLYPSPFPDACSGPVYQLVRPGFLIYETEGPAPEYDERSHRMAERLSRWRRRQRAPRPNELWRPTETRC